MDMSLSKLWESVMDREAWAAAVHGVAKSQTWLSDWTELNWRTSPEAIFPDYSEKLLWRSRLFSTVLYLVRTKNFKQIRVTFLQCFKKKKKKTSTYAVSQDGLSTWKGSVYHQKSTSIGIPGRGAFNFSHKHFFFTSVQCALFLNNESRCPM